jgi:integrase
MSDQAILLMLRKRGREAKIAPFTPHDLRRTFIGDHAGADMAVVQRLAGHASVQTTARYDRRGEETKRRRWSGARGFHGGGSTGRGQSRCMHAETSDLRH